MRNFKIVFACLIMIFSFVIINFYNKANALTCLKDDDCPPKQICKPKEVNGKPDLSRPGDCVPEPTPPPSRCQRATYCPGNINENPADWTCCFNHPCCPGKAACLGTDACSTTPTPAPECRQDSDCEPTHICNAEGKCVRVWSGGDSVPTDTDIPLEEPIAP